MMDEQKQYEVLTTQALEAQRLRDEGSAGRLAIAAALERHVESKR